MPQPRTSATKKGVERAPSARPVHQLEISCLSDDFRPAPFGGTSVEQLVPAYKEHTPRAVTQPTGISRWSSMVYRPITRPENHSDANCKCGKQKTPPGFGGVQVFLKRPMQPARTYPIHLYSSPEWLGVRHNMPIHRQTSVPDGARILKISCALFLQLTKLTSDCQQHFLSHV